MGKISAVTCAEKASASASGVAVAASASLAKAGSRWVRILVKVITVSPATAHLSGYFPRWRFVWFSGQGIRPHHRDMWISPHAQTSVDMGQEKKYGCRREVVL
jgi:hypothetical protein